MPRLRSLPPAPTRVDPVVIKLTYTWERPQDCACGRASDVAAYPSSCPRAAHPTSRRQVHSCGRSHRAPLASPIARTVPADATGALRRGRLSIPTLINMHPKPGEGSHPFLIVGVRSPVPAHRALSINRYPQSRCGQRRPRLPS